MASMETTHINFNSRPCVRGDGNAAKFVNYYDKFQFTPLREGRLPQLLCSTQQILFQFTPLREGRLTEYFIVVAELAISIHAPA